jgi:hypothetical protein
MAGRGTPRIARWLANECRRPCIVTRFASPARRQAVGTTSFAIECDSGFPSGWQKT